MDESETARQLTVVSVAYAILFYAAALTLILGLIAKFRTLFRIRPALDLHGEAPPRTAGGMALKVLTDLVMFRGTFFDDRWAWIFSALFHYGFALVVLRHLRYALDPSWTGPAWILVVLAQPLGLYGGLAMMAGVAGFWARRLIVPRLKAESTYADHAMLALLLAIPAIGYFNNYVHTDIIAVKGFFVGLATLHWQPLPADPLLLLHLWLVAVLLMALPFSKILHLGGVFELLPPEATAGAAKELKARLISGAVLALFLGGAALSGVYQVANEGWTKPQPDFSRLARVHKSQDPTVMIRNHPSFLMDHRSTVVYQGVRQENDNIERCVTCHAVKGADGQPVGFEDPNHFCRGCHNKAAVSIDCFECHNSKPAAKTSAIERKRTTDLASRESETGSVLR